MTQPVASGGHQAAGERGKERGGMREDHREWQERETSSALPYGPIAPTCNIYTLQITCITSRSHCHSGRSGLASRPLIRRDGRESVLNSGDGGRSSAESRKTECASGARLRRSAHCAFTTPMGLLLPSMSVILCNEVCMCGKIPITAAFEHDLVLH
jgi:hypothetical protein